VFQQVKKVVPEKIFRDSHYNRSEKEPESSQYKPPERNARIFPVFIYNEYKNTDAEK
jgi:hypothetical protein